VIAAGRNETDGIYCPIVRRETDRFNFKTYIFTRIINAFELKVWVLKHITRKETAIYII